jgi:hypothetical protein
MAATLVGIQVYTPSTIGAGWVWQHPEEMLSFPARSESSTPFIDGPNAPLCDDDSIKLGRITWLYRAFDGSA